MFTGIIFTDILRIANKLNEKPGKIAHLISSYISDCSPYIEWILADVSDQMYDDIDKTNWHSYFNILHDFYIGLGLQKSYNCPLFIIGDDDIIPMPIVDNPLFGAGREHLYSDMFYCYSRPDIELAQIVLEYPLFAVGRLPIVNQTKFSEMQKYLADCHQFTINGIAVRGAAMTTTESWFRASKEMMSDLPSIKLSDSHVPLNEGLIVSPALDTQYQDMYDGYIHELKKIDFLVCNLHGSDEPLCPFFIGEDNNHNKNTIATQPSMLSATSPLIFNTVACYGARYMGYDIKASMLMQAIAHGTILYCGACDTSIGGYNNAGNSELLMKLYSIYLHKGFPAGMALLKAKQDYYCTCHNIDGDEYAMYTIMEFNLFGCPILYMQPKLESNYHISLLGLSIIEGHAPSYNPKIATPIVENVYQADDIHAYLRGLVDNNLSIIRSKIEEEVYRRLGLGKENLQHIYRLSRNNTEIGYNFVYHQRQHNPQFKIDVYYFVETNTKGDISKIIQTK